MKQKTQWHLFLFYQVAFIILALSAAHAQGQTPDANKYGGTLKIAVSRDFKSLDARYLGAFGGSIRGQSQLYNRLVEYGPKGMQDTIPALATSWKKIDEVTWLVAIRKGVKFHNGKEMTAYDIAKNYDWRVNRKKYTEERGWKPPRGTTHSSQIKSVEALDQFTLKFTLKYPFVPFVAMNLGWGTRGIIDPDIVEKYEKQATLHPVGTGPFKLGEHVSGSHLILERFDDYWGGKAYLERVIIRIIPDAQTRLIALQKGEVDIATDFLFNQLPLIQKDPHLRSSIIMEPKTSPWGVIWFNFRRWPMNQLKFRQAVAMGADWRMIARKMFPKGIDPERHTFFEHFWLENKQAKKLLPTYNPQQAKALLREVEQAAGRPIPRLYAMTSNGRQGIPGAVLQIGALELRKIGLNLDLHLLEDEVVRDVLKRNPKSEWDIRIGPYDAPGLDPAETVTEFYSKTPGNADGKSDSAYTNPRIDELYLQGASTDKREKRKKIYQEMEIILLKDLVGLPLFDLPYIYAYNKRVQDFPAHQSAHLLFRTSWNNVWLEKQKK